MNTRFEKIITLSIFLFLDFLFSITIPLILFLIIKGIGLVCNHFGMPDDYWGWRILEKSVATALFVFFVEDFVKSVVFSLHKCRDKYRKKAVQTIPLVLTI